MVKPMKTAKGPSRQVMKRLAIKASESSFSCKQQSSSASTKATLWRPIKVSSSFVSQVELEQKREILKGDIERKERELSVIRDQLRKVDAELKAREDNLHQAKGDPTGKLLNVSVRQESSKLAVSCRLLSGNLSFVANLPLDATVGDLQHQVHENMHWAASECIDPFSNAMPGHAGLHSSCTDFVVKEMELKEVVHLSAFAMVLRSSRAASLLKDLKLPLKYEQKERWEDAQGVGGHGHIKLEFRTSTSDGILKFGRLVDLKDNVGIKRCEELIHSAKYQGKYKAPLGYFSFSETIGKKGVQINRSRGPSRIEVVNSESRLKKILRDLVEEADAFAGADWDSVSNRRDPFAEVERRIRESRKIMEATLAWIEKSCDSGLLSAMYVRLEHGERTFDRYSSSEESEEELRMATDVDSQTPGRSIVQGTGILFLKAPSGTIGRLSLEKRTDDFAGAY